MRQIESNQELLTSSEAILKYGLNWNVVKKNVVVDGKVAEDFKAIVREDTNRIFQIAGSRYEPIQNVEAFKFFDEITKTGQAKYVQAGAYKGGAVCFLRAKLPFDFEVLPNDQMKTYLKLVTSHDGSQKLAIYPEVYRQICSNGMHAWVRDYTKTVAVKHTENAGTRFVFNAERVLNAEIEYFKKFSEQCRLLAKKQLSTIELDNFLKELFEIKEEDEVSTRTKNQVDRIKELSEIGTGQDIAGIRGTAWSAYNAVTEFVDKYRSTKGDDENREYSADFGSGADLREKAFALLSK